MKGQLASAFAELVKQVYCAAPHSVVSPAQLKRVVGKWAPHFSGYNQQDCQEFLRFLLDGIGEDLNRARTWPDDAPKKKGGVLARLEQVLTHLRRSATYLYLYKIVQYLLFYQYRISCCIEFKIFV